MAKPSVAISIPTYNRANGYMRAALASAVAQRYENLEIMVSDNASTDNTAEVVASFNDPRIRYVKHPQNIGPANNFRYCVEGVTSDYVLMLHDDDLIDADFIETCMAALGDRTDVGMIRTGVRLIDGEGHLMEEFPNRARSTNAVEFMREWMTGTTALYLCCTLFHRQRLLDVGGFRSKKQLFDDVVAEMKLAARYARVEVPDIKASYRRHGVNFGNSAKIRDWAEESLFLIDVMAEAAGSEAAAIRHEALDYFCRKNYAYTARLASRWQRLQTYFLVDKMFHHHYPLWRFLYDRSVKGRWQRLLNRE